MRGRFLRVFFFAIAILIGLAAGVVYGWVINPVQYENTTLNTLHIDYQTDFVLMTAELHHHEGDVSLALARLNYLGEGPPLVKINEAVDYAEISHYAPEDMRLMWDLASAIQIKLDE